MNERYELASRISRKMGHTCFTSRWVLSGSLAKRMRASLFVEAVLRPIFEPWFGIRAHLLIRRPSSVSGPIGVTNGSRQDCSALSETSLRPVLRASCGDTLLLYWFALTL